LFSPQETVGPVITFVVFVTGVVVVLLIIGIHVLSASVYTNPGGHYLQIPSIKCFGVKQTQFLPVESTSRL
jgi:hypothetical protein